MKYAHEGMWIFCSDKRGNSKRERWKMRNRGEGEKDALHQNGQEIDQCTEAMNREEGVLELLDSELTSKHRVQVIWIIEISATHSIQRQRSRNITAESMFSILEY